MNIKTAWLSKSIFKTARWLVSVFYGKHDVEFIENPPENNTVFVANHAQMNGPIVGELFMPQNCYIWCAGQMMNIKEVPKYAFCDFWSKKPKWIRPFYKLLSYIIAPLSVSIFNNARTVAVYCDSRIFSTFKESVNMLKEGKNLLIFPEKNETYNNIIYRFHENFIDIARVYYKKTGTELTFVPMYISPSLKKTYLGKGIKYNGEKDIAEERARIAEYLSNEITEIARNLPEHTVVPYRNIPKKHYLSNKDISSVPTERLE